MDIDLDKPREECGIVGVFGHPEAANLAYLGLYALQHRGQEAGGIVSADGERLYTHKGQGLVHDIFTEKTLETLKGSMAIGHVRYSTTGSNVIANVQPIVATYRNGDMAMAHNGNIVNAAELRRELQARGAIFIGSSDTEVLLHLIAQSGIEDFEEALKVSLRRLKGAFSLLIAREDRLYAIKDPNGIRPLCIGQLGEGYVVASESCALDLLEAQYLKEVKPGDMVVFDEAGVRVERPFPPAEERFCVFEYIYFSRPDSMIGSRSISEIRKRMGRRLAVDHPADADIVISVPDSSNSAAAGYAEQSGLPFRIGLIRNHYVGRTFIEPESSIRHFGVKLKFNAVRSELQDKRVVVVDDSIVRGTTGKKIVAMLRKAGAREVHMRVTAPVWRNPCYYGIDTPSEGELIGNRLTHEEIAKWMGVDSIGFLAVESLLECVPKNRTYCTACFTGQYDAGKPKEFVKDQHEVKGAALVSP